jgi:addiction module HigA family antidote
MMNEARLAVFIWMTIVISEEFMEPLAVTQGQLAKAMVVSRRMINEICNNKRSVMVDTALMLAKVFGNTPDFWLNVQRRNDLREALHTPKRMARPARARPIQEVTA